jgi:protocatechuate 3,4-dioxygenase beta subunit
MKLACLSLLGFLLAIAAGPIFAQTTSTENSSASIQTTHDRAVATVAGIVTKDPGGEPMKKALVELIAESQSTGGNHTALTGADGAFHMANIAPGRYRLFAERTGYLEVDKHRPRPDGRLLTLTAGQELTDVLIRLQAAAVIEGRVTDEDGDPLAEAQVSVLRQTFALGRRHWEQAGGERTNDLGEYRIANLPAGSYYISITPPLDFKSLIEGADAPASDPRNAATGSPERPAPTSYKTTYYPGTKERTQAAPVDLHAGDDFPANFSLTPSPSVLIRGSITNLAPGASAVVMLQSKDSNLTQQSAAEGKKNGSFEIRDVSPGAYTLVGAVTDATGTKLARQTVQVSSANVEGIRLALQPGGWIHGYLRLESKTRMGRFTPAKVSLSLLPGDGDDDVSSAMPILESFAPLAHVNFDGSFEWKDVPPGHYYIQFSGDESMSPDWFLKSVIVGGRDVIDTGFSVNGGAAVLDLVASADGAVVDGLVANAKGAPVANAVVVAVPEPHFRSRTDRYYKTVTDQSGHFTLHAVTPGAYTLIAWESVDGEAYYNPEFLSKYEGQGRALHLSEGERTSVQLGAVSWEEASADQP